MGVNKEQLNFRISFFLSFTSLRCGQSGWPTTSRPLQVWDLTQFLKASLSDVCSNLILSALAALVVSSASRIRQPWTPDATQTFFCLRWKAT